MLSYSFDQPLPTYALGAASWPRALLTALALLGLLLLFFPQPSNAGRTSRPENSSDFQLLSPGARNRALVLLLPLLYTWLMNLVGFLLITPPFLLLLIYFFGFRRPLALVTTVTVFYLLIVILFVRLTFIPFPVGSGEFNTLNNQYIEWIRTLGNEA